MKEQAIQKINQIGKVSSVIALIAKILVGIGILGVIIGAITCFVIPEKLVNVTTAGTMELDIDVSELGVTIPEDQRETVIAEMQKEFADSDEDFEGGAAISVDGNNIQISGKMEENTFTIRHAAWAVAMAGIILVMTFVTLCFVSGLCKAFRDCTSPFEENVIKKMQNLAISLIPWCIISSVADSTLDSIINGKPMISFSIDLGIVLVVLVVLVLVYIFKYGAVLQQESDETL